MVVRGNLDSSGSGCDSSDSVAWCCCYLGTWFSILRTTKIECGMLLLGEMKNDVSEALLDVFHTVCYGALILQEPLNRIRCVLSRTRSKKGSTMRFCCLDTDMCFSGIFVGGSAREKVKNSASRLYDKNDRIFLNQEQPNPFVIKRSLP